MHRSIPGLNQLLDEATTLKCSAKLCNRHGEDKGRRSDGLPCPLLMLIAFRQFNEQTNARTSSK
jgi:hypothetical protein